MLENIVYWHWMVLGLALIILEVLLPSAIFLWPGVAALIVGILFFVFPVMSATMQLALFAVFAVIAALGWQLYRKNNPAETPIPSMNNRGMQYVGRHFTLPENVVNGVGTLNVDDTRWKVMSDQDFSAGTKVTVTGLDGTSLRIVRTEE